MSKNILHIGGDTFIPPFIEFVKEHFEFDEHEFFITGGVAEHEIKSSPNVKLWKKGKANRIKEYLQLIAPMHKSKKIFLHGLFNWHIVVILFFMPWLLKKCYWIIWGGDLYVHSLGEKNLKWKISEFFRRPVIKHMGNLVTYIPGDVELSRKWYGAKGKYHECLMYQSNVVKPEIITSTQFGYKNHVGLNILVGNSADPGNNHIETLEKLLPYKDKEIKIFVPLSYGDQQNANNVISIGKSWFGDKFIPLTSFMVFEQYLSFLADIDIALFNHKRQQAMGNTITLLGMGKTVYIRSDVSQWSFFTEKNIICFDIDYFNMEKVSSTQSSSNINTCLDYFNINTLIHQYSEMFNHD